MIGVDIIEIDRIKKAINRGTFYQKAYGDIEKQYFSKYNNVESLAGFFCAKEALCKALGIGLVFPLTDIMVAHKSNGQPYFVLKNKVAQLVCDRKVELSISHCNSYAIAMVIID